MTSTPFLFLMAILSGVCLFTGVNLLLLAWRGSTKQVHISFAVMSLMVGGFIIAQNFAYAATTSVELIVWRRIDIALAILIFVALGWFIAFYTEWPGKRIPIALTGSAMLLEIVNLLTPHGIMYPAAPAVKRFALPWGEMVTDISLHAKSIWFYLAWLLVISVFIYLFVASSRMYRHGNRARARILMYSAGVFLLFVLTNQLANFNLVQFVYLAPFGFIAMIIMMGLYLNWEHQRVNRLLHTSEGRYAAVIASTVDGIIITDAHQRIQVFNTAAEHLFGYRAAEVNGRPIDCLFAEGPRWGYQQQLRDIASDKPEMSSVQRYGRIRGLRADGREFPLDASFSQVSLHGDRFISAIVRDARDSQKDKEALKVSAERYRALVGNIPGMIYRAAPAAPWHMQFVSDGVQLISGQAASAYFGERAEHWLDRVVIEDRPVVEDAYTRLVTQRNPVEFSYRIRHSDNSIRWVQDRAQLVSNALGQPLWIDGLALDITRQKEAEHAAANAYSRLETQVQDRTRELSRIIDRFNEAQRVASLGSWELDLVTNKLEWSDEIFRIFAIDKNRFGTSYEAFLNAIHPDDRERVNRAYTESVAKQLPYEIKHRLLLPDGQIKYVHERAVTHYDPQGKPLHSLGTVQDITELVLIENQLLETTALLNSIIDNLPSMIFLKHAENLQFALLNKTGEELLGLSRAELQGKNDYDFFPREQADFFTAKDRAVLAQDGLVDIPEEPLDTLHHGRRILHTRKIALRDAQGLPRYLLGISEDITARIETEKQLRIKDAAITYSLNAIAIADLSGTLLYINPAFCTMWGVANPQDILGQSATVFSIGPPSVAEIIAVLLDRGQWQGELPAVDLRGNTFNLELSATVIRDAEGRPTHLAGSFLDISERVAAMQTMAKHDQELQQLNADLEQRVVARTRELEEAQQFNAAVVDTVGALVVVLERSGQIILFNHACELTSGYSNAEVLGKYVWDFLLLPEEREPVKQVFGKLTAGDFPSAYENYWVHRGGALRRIAWSNTAITDAAGKVEFVIGTGVDITQRRAAEIALRNSEELFRQLTENIREVFFVRNLNEHRMIYVSPAFETLFNLPRERLYSDSRAFFERVHPDDIAAVLAAVQAQQEQQQYFNREYRIIPRPGELRWVWVRTFPICDDNGDVYRLAGLVEDITERRIAEEQRLAQARAQRDLLVREVHHRIKNNLQGIIGLLRRHVSSQPELQPAVDSAITQVNAMALVHGLQGKAVSERIRLCDLTEAIATSIAGLTGVNIKPQVERVTVRPVLVAEEEAVPIALIINELLFNAVKHSPAGTQQPILVNIDCHDQKIWMTIRSHGKALPAGFDLQQGRGVGTGLQLVKALLPGHCSVEMDEIDGFTQTILKLAPPAVVIPIECTQ